MFRPSTLVVCLVVCASCSTPPTPCSSSTECAGTLRCINGTCSDASACIAEDLSAFCIRKGKSCGVVSAEDNCGALRSAICGQCQVPNVCDNGICSACVPETDGALCASQGKNCGMTSLTDKCGKLRNLNCGDCTGSQACGGGGMANVCGGCVPESDAEFCTAQGNKNCGAVSGTDRCGNMRTSRCGQSCPLNTTCGGGGSPNVCGCSPETDMGFCSRLGKNCNPVTNSDNCGLMRTANCGTCMGASVCGGGGPANICSGCIPESDPAFCARIGKTCGPVNGVDNCGQARNASCGACTGTDTCGGGGTTNVCGCTPESDVLFCSRLGATCGVHTAADNCGAMRTRTCGNCQAPQSCGAVTPNQCGCTPESAAAFCTRLGKNCDLVSAFDSCGTNRSENCGICSAGTCGGGGVPNVCGCSMETDAQLCTRHMRNCGTPSLVDLCGMTRTVMCGPMCTGPQNLLFTNAFQTLPNTGATAVEFRCDGQVDASGRKCSYATGTTTSVVQLKIAGTSYALAVTKYGLTTTVPSGAMFHDNSGYGANLLCEAMGWVYSGTQAQYQEGTTAPAAVVQTNPFVYGTGTSSADGPTFYGSVECSPDAGPL